MEKLMAKHWHHTPGEAVVELLQSHSQRGLDEFEVKHRQERFGPNIITGKGGKAPSCAFCCSSTNRSSTFCWWPES